MELERVVFFSDAVIAIAITLLVVEISIPTASEDVGHALLDRWPEILSFVISFLVIGVFWVAHHRIFRYVARLDSGLLWLNLLFLMCIAFLPFPTAVLGDHDISRTSVVFYACVVGVTGLMLTLIWQYVIHAGLLNDKADPQIVTYLTYRSLVTPIAFFASVPLAFINVRLAQAAWFMPFVGIALVTRRQRS